MSEPVLKPVPSGTGLDRAGTGRYTALTRGNAGQGAGNPLPRAAVKQPDPERLVQQLNIVNREIGRDLRFQVDLDQGYAVIQVLDRETGELIRQIPPEKSSLSLKANGSLQIRLFDELI